ncbi:MAG: hypothetical protein J6D27_00280 [Ruminiclostridium sp.]|nr:hypothetical protein [Ruminiclostridium sp.]
MNRLDTETRERLIRIAQNYDKEQLNLFQGELGWEEWMEQFTEAADGEPITEAESDVIDGITAEIFATAHKEEVAESDEDMEI